MNEKYITVEPSAEVPGEIEITVKGPWLHTILFEIPVLAIVNEIYFRRAHPFPDYAEGRRRLAIATLRPFGVSSAMPSRESECAASTPDRARKIRSFGLVTAGDGG